MIVIRSSQKIINLEDVRRKTYLGKAYSVGDEHCAMVKIISIDVRDLGDDEEDVDYLAIYVAEHRNGYTIETNYPVSGMALEGKFYDEVHVDEFYELLTDAIEDVRRKEDYVCT